MKKSALIGVIAVAALTLTACTANTEVASTDEPVDLRFALWDEVQMPAAEALVEAFEDAHPNIDIQIELTAFDQYWTKLETAATGKSAPDVFWTAPAYYQKYAANGIIADLKPLIERDSVDLDGIYPALIDGFTFEQGLYAMPKDIDSISLWYNTELFDQAGLAYPDASWDWETLRAAARTLTNVEAGTWGIAAQGGDGRDRASYFTTIPQAGGEILTSEGASGFDTPEAIDGVQFWVDFINEGLSPNVQQLADTGAENLFMTGKVAMLYDGSWRASLFAGDEYAGSRVNVAPLPAGPAGRQTSVNGLGYAMYAESAHPDEAWEFIKFLGTPAASKIQAESGAVIPAHEAEAATWVESLPQFDLQVFIDAAAGDGVFVPVTIDTAVWRDEAKAIFQRAYLGEVSVADAASEAATFMNDALTDERD